MRGSLQAYKKVSIDSQLNSASPHKVIQMLLDGAIERLIQAKVAIENNDTALKGDRLCKGLDIILSLRGSLSIESGGEIAKNLDSLYEYMIRQISLANLENNSSLINECVHILGEIKSAWEQIPIEYHNITQTQT